jgi:SAM-dependent methyltransferase
MMNAFDLHSRDYDAWFDAHPAAFKAEVEAVRQLMPANGAGIEIGVGTGRFAQALGLGEGIDPSAAMRAMAEARGIRVYEGVAEALPLPDGSYEVVLMVTTICFVDDPVKAFREAHRVLRPGGHLLVGFIDGTSDLGQRYASRKNESKFYRDAHFYTCADVIQALETAGFAIRSSRQTLFSDPEKPDDPDPILPGYGKGGFVVFLADRLESGRAQTVATIG